MMGPLKQVTWAVLLGVTVAQNCTFEEITPSRSLTWCPCETDFFCAKLDVPLDYLNPKLGRASVPLLKVAAQMNSSDGPYQGIVLINPGGPGGSGLDMARFAGGIIQGVAGTNWDVVGFDPRGVGLSEPRPNCSRSNGTLLERSVPRITDEFYISYIDFGRDLAESCEELDGAETSATRHMSTSVTAKDMLSIVDAFADTEDGQRASKPSNLLNYYGISYGSFLGQTFASMFPERVGNMAIDGMVSPQGYLDNSTSASVTDLDGVLATFFMYCHEAGEADCPYSTGSTPQDIFHRFKRSFGQLDARRAQAENWANATDIALALLSFKVRTILAVNAPLQEFPSFAETLVELETALEAEDIRPWIESVMQVIGDPSPAGLFDPEQLFGVLCSDQNGSLYNRTLEELQPLIQELEDESIIGEIWVRSVLGCVGWSIRSNDVFSGPFCGETANPILFVSNTYDPVTPIQNSISSAPNYRGAEILTIDSTGHTSPSANNQCGFARLRAYFQANELPGENNFCPLEQGPFGIVLNGTLRENIERAGLSDLHW